jgi:putative oxidoreductase
MGMLGKSATILEAERRVLTWLQAPFLLFVRIYWGVGFVLTGWGKLTHLDRVATWFGEQLHLPAPHFLAALVGGTELVGGALLVIGLGGRVATIPLVISMCVAYLTADSGGLQGLWLWLQGPWSADARCQAVPGCESFESATAFSFWMASVIVLLFGAGPWSVDGLVARWWARRPSSAG